ncbi:MAG: hypothetical protein R2747_13490 [Pyrinomonadaceae bacterium]
MKKNRLFLLIIFCFAAHSASAQTAPSFSPEIKRVAVFKNGYAFTYREGQAQPQNGWVYTNNIPIGALGTIWGYSTSPEVRVSQLLAGESQKSENAAIETIAEALLANEGKRIRFTDNYNKQFEGVYQILGKNRLLRPEPEEADSNVRQPGELTIALKTETGMILFPVSTIRNIEISGELKLDKTVLLKENRLMINVDGARNGQNINLGVAALERGIRWIPAYRVEIKGTPVNQAKLELEANIINELTDLKDSEVYFVVGVPHFLFQDLMSPLSINTAFAGVSNYFQVGRDRRDSFSNAIATQVAYNREDDTGSSQTPSPTVFGEEKLTSFSAEQLFLYRTERLSLKKKERASLRLFSLTVPATEVFEWTINDAPDIQQRYLEYARSSNSQALTQELSSKVWYALRLKNETGMPWTTAPALTFREWKPIGQDMLTFTSVGGENILRVTPATEVIGDHDLKETSRERVQLNYGGSQYNFDLITVEGAIKLRNIKKEAVEMVLTRNLVGEVLEAGDGGNISREGLNLQAVNPNSIIKWNLTLPPGEKEIRYTYKIYVRR